MQVARALQHTATHCNTLQHTATHCNTLQHNLGTWLGASGTRAKIFHDDVFVTFFDVKVKTLTSHAKRGHVPKLKIMKKNFKNTFVYRDISVYIYICMSVYM